MPPRLIPPTIPLTTPSEGERVVFAAFADAKGADDWIVLHSLDLANHQRRLAGEIDFLVIVPGKGVLVLEVKGAHHLRRHDGLWFYGSDQRPDERGPFKQASEAMHSLRERLVRQHRDLARVVFWSAVCFPFVDFDETSEEWHPWQVIDRRALAKRSLDAALRERARPRSSRSWSPTKSPGFTPSATSLANSRSPSCCATCAATSSSSRAPSRGRSASTTRCAATPRSSSRRSRRSTPTRVSSSTGRRAPARRCSQSKRPAAARSPGGACCCCASTGRSAAGSPTRPAELLPAVRRDAAEHAGAEARPTARRPLPGSSARTIDEHLRRAGDATQHYDEIVVDEAQDMLRPDYLKALDLSLTGGLAGGVYRFFGDFGRPGLSDSRHARRRRHGARRAAGARRRRAPARCATTCASTAATHPAWRSSPAPAAAWRAATAACAAPTTSPSRRSATGATRRQQAKPARRHAPRARRTGVRRPAHGRAEPPRRRSVLRARPGRATLDGAPRALARRAAPPPTSTSSSCTRAPRATARSAGSRASKRPPSCSPTSPTSTRPRPARRSTWAAPGRCERLVILAHESLKAKLEPIA